jgi:hypothetical protein
MKKAILSVFLLSLFYNLLAQKTINDPNAEPRSVGSFHGIEVATGIKLVLTEGSTEAVAVSADKVEYRDRIVTKVENGILKIHYESQVGAINKQNQSKNLRAYVSYKTLDRLNVNTGAEVQIEGVLKSSSLDIKANTGGIVKGEIEITKLDVDQNTGSRISFTGKAEELDVEGDTGSRFMGEDLKVSNCTAEVGTGAQVIITVQKEISAKANTGGSIKFKGDSAIKNIKTGTGGSVSKI